MTLGDVLVSYALPEPTFSLGERDVGGGGLLSLASVNVLLDTPAALRIAELLRIVLVDTRTREEQRGEQRARIAGGDLAARTVRLGVLAFRGEFLHALGSR